MEAAEKETVIIVHGTWAAPEAGMTRWYQPACSIPIENHFVSKLDGALAERESSARCWAHCPDNQHIFHWTGENDWIARTHAASALKDYVIALVKAGWRCHIIAHSHGGNVVAQALSNMPDDFDRLPGKIVTLGTPFIDTMSPVLKTAERKRKTAEIASWMGIAILFLAFTFLICFAFWDTLNQSQVKLTYEVLFLAITYVLTCAGIIWLIRRRYRKVNESRIRNNEKASEARPELLAISSPVDEAWQILHHMRNVQNPLAVRSNLPRHVLSVLRASVSNSASIARIQGAKTYRDFGKGGKYALIGAHLLTGLTVIAGLRLVLAEYELRPVIAQLGTIGLGAGLRLAEMAIFFLLNLLATFTVVAVLTNSLGRDFYSAYSSPFRWCAHRIGCLPNVFSALATYMLRRKAWSFLQTIAMGVEGYGYALPVVEQHPNCTTTRVIKYENIPAASERRALKSRSDWVGLHLADVSQAFAKIAITAVDVTHMLRIVEADQSLVHGVYYTDDDCIARIADWIADRG